MRHALALQLVKKLVEVDMSWMESHIGGDPYKIRVFDQGKLPGSRDANRGHLANPPHAPLLTGTPSKHGSQGLHATHSPLMKTPSTALPHPPSSLEGDDGPPSEDGGEGLHATHFPLMTSLSPAPPQPPISPEGDDGPPSEHEGEGLHNTHLPSITTHSHALPNTPTSSEGDGDLQPPSEPDMVIDDDGLPLPSKLPPMATDYDSLQSPPKPTQPPISPTIDMHMTISNVGLRPPLIPPPMDMENSMSSHGKETPLLIAAGKGIVEIVEEILAVYPQAVEYINDKGRNILHVAVQRRQTEIFKLVRTRDTIPLIRLNRRIDGEGNSVLHHAAKLDENDPQVNHLRNIPGEALQMQWEIQWFKVHSSFLPYHNCISFQL